jgi:hypothetical protein
VSIVSEVVASRAGPGSPSGAGPPRECARIEVPRVVEACPCGCTGRFDLIAPAVAERGPPDRRPSRFVTSSPLGPGDRRHAQRLALAQPADPCQTSHRGRFAACPTARRLRPCRLPDARRPLALPSRMVPGRRRDVLPRQIGRRPAKDVKGGPSPRGADAPGPTSGGSAGPRGVGCRTKWGGQGPTRKDARPFRGRRKGPMTRRWRRAGAVARSRVGLGASPAPLRHRSGSFSVPSSCGALRLGTALPQRFQNSRAIRRATSPPGLTSAHSGV